MPYTGGLPAVEPPSAAGLLNMFVAIFEASPVLTSVTFEPVGGASSPSHGTDSLLLPIYTYPTPAARPWAASGRRKARLQQEQHSG